MGFKAKAGKTQQDHGPGGGLGDSRDVRGQGARIVLVEPVYTTEPASAKPRDKVVAPTGTTTPSFKLPIVNTDHGVERLGLPNVPTRAI
jgi:hypothetical protein